MPNAVRGGQPRAQIGPSSVRADAPETLWGISNSPRRLIEIPTATGAATDLAPYGAGFIDAVTRRPTMGPACPQIVGRVPEEAIREALANPDRHAGWQQLQKPHQRPSPYNEVRDRLTIRNLAVPWNRENNGLIWRAHCP